MISWRLGSAFAALAITILVIIAGSVHVVFSYIQTTMLGIGELQTEQRSVALGDARRAEVTLILGVSKLSIKGGADALMDSEFRYYTPPLHTSFAYSVTEGVGQLFFSHANPDVVPNFERSPEFESHAVVQLNENVPLSLTLGLGIHQGHLNFDGLDLTELIIALAGGNCEIDLRGKWQRSFTIEVDNGFGEATILLPADTGVRVHFPEQDEGEIAVKGLTLSGDTYVNEALSNSDVILDVKVEDISGRVRLEVAP